MSRLALLGGKKIRTKPFPAYTTIDSQEEKAVIRVLRSNILSKYIGAWHENFMGGPEVQSLEAEWADYFKISHAIAVNSATSALITAVGSLGINPGDEVIVSPYTMSASAIAPLFYGAIPVFADIEPKYFCLDPRSVEKQITPRTKGIIVVDLFGQPYNAGAINKLAKKNHLWVIEDCAQAPGAKYFNKSAGTLGDMGVYSLNYHKHIHTGEGGILVTNNSELAERARLIRNHAESVVANRKMKSYANLVGFNFRMTELEACIAREQLKKLEGLTELRIKNVNYFNCKLTDIPGIIPAPVRPGCRHVYYAQPLLFNPKKFRIHRDLFIKAVKAELAPTKLRENEGVMMGCGYVKPLYMLPLFKRKIAFGNHGYPWISSHYKGKVEYSEGLCPICESCHFETLVSHELIRPPMTHGDMDDVINAFQKVITHQDELNGIENPVNNN